MTSQEVQSPIKQIIDRVPWENQGSHPIIIHIKLPEVLYFLSHPHNSGTVMSNQDYVR